MMSNIGMGGGLILLLSLSPFFLILCIVLYGLRVISRIDKRQEKRLEIDRQHLSIQQQQISLLASLNERLVKVEKTLDEVH